MAGVTIDLVIKQLLIVLDEGIEGSKEQWSYFTDSGPEGALLGTLAKLSAAEASQVIGNTSIAAHVHHVIFGIAAAASFIRGERIKRDWDESWRVSTVDAPAWKALQQQLRAGYQELRQAVASHAGDSEASIGSSIGAAAHLAYHLGEIKEKIACMRPS